MGTETPLTQCPNHGVPYLVGDFKEAQKRTIVKARCKQWDCPFCMHINKSEHYNRIAGGLQKLMKNDCDWSFVTITCHEKWRGHANSIRNWRKNKDKLLARYRYNCRKNNGGKSDYVYIPETHKDGTIHLHGCFAGDFKNRWWKDNCRQSGLGYMSEGERLKTVLQAVNYCLKYITKHVGQAQVMPNFRRICYSQQFPILERRASVGEWRILEREQTIESAISGGLIGLGYEVHFDGMKFTSLDDLL